jgi:hypothetical protein
MRRAASAKAAPKQIAVEQHEAYTKPVKTQADPGRKTSQPNTLAENTEFALDVIRLVSRRLKEIDQEVVTIGTALAQGRMPPRIALNLIEQIAPGCIGATYLSLFEDVLPEPSEGGGQ